MNIKKQSKHRVPEPGRRAMWRGARRRRGFTLLEVLVSLIIFGIITLALSMALAASLRAQGSLQAEQEHSARIRAVFDLLTRDIEAAYGSLNSSSSVFIGGGSGGSQSSIAPGSLLTLSSLSHHIQADDLASQSANSDGPNPAAGSGLENGIPTPQWDCNLIRYDLDAQKGILRRMSSPIPNLQTLTPQSDPGVQTIVTDHILALTLRYWDGTQQTWRDNWDFEQQNQAPSTPQAGTGGSAGQTSTSTAQASSSSSGDTYLPSAVEVTLVLRGNGGAPMTYVTVIPIIAPQPETNATGTAAPAAPAGTTGTTASGGTTGT